MEKFMTSLRDLVTTWQPLVWMLVAISLIGVGVMFVVPSQEIKQKASRALPWVVVGCGIALLATTIAKEISGAFGMMVVE